MQFVLLWQRHYLTEWLQRAGVVYHVVLLQGQLMDLHLPSWRSGKFQLTCTGSQNHLEQWDSLVPQEHWTIKELFLADENREIQLKNYRLIRDEINTHVCELVKRIGNNT